MRIAEQTAAAFDRVDHAAGLIRGVAILGEVSANGRRYAEGAIREAATLYEGVEVNWDHLDDDEDPDRRPSLDAVAAIENVRFDAGKLRGDIRVYQKHPYGPLLLERAEKGPGRFGLSHVIEGAIDDGEVTLIERVYSVDVVRKPATNRNLFESEGRGAMKATVATLAEALRNGSAERSALSSALAANPTVGKVAVEIDEAWSEPQKTCAVLSAALLALAESRAQPTPPAEGKVGGVDQNALDSVLHEVKSLREELAATGRRETAGRVLLDEGVAPDAEMLDELVALGDEQKMREAVKSWPEAKKITPNPRIRQSGDATDEGALPAGIAHLIESRKS